jgi:hypothetical protein
VRIRPALSLLSALALSGGLALAAPAGAAGPQVIDPANDANFLNGQGFEAEYEADVPLPRNNPTPVGSQAYADVLSITWTRMTAKAGKKQVFSGFKVAMKLSGPPTPPAPTILVFRMFGQVNGNPDLLVGPVLYTSPLTGAPQSALRDTLGPDNVVRLTAIPMPVIAGSTVTWTVPKSALPKELAIGSTLKNLYCEVREIESFQGLTVPATVPVVEEPIPSVGGATGLATGIIERADSASSFKIG